MSSIQMVAADAMALFSRRPPWRWMLGGLAFVLLVVSGIGAVMAWAPTPTEVAGERVVQSESPLRPVVDSPVSQHCAECGTIESSRRVARYPEGLDRDTAKMVMAGGHNEMSAPALTISEVTVRMSDGTSRQFNDASLSNWRPGERMIFIEGTSATGH